MTTSSKKPARKHNSRRRHNSPKVYRQVEPVYNKILTGVMLVVDPSSGSGNSMPGYAIYRAGEFHESGTVDLDTSMSLSRRLYEINRTFREEFEQPDVLVVENIPPISYGGRGMPAASLMSLHKAIGAVICAWDIGNLVEVHPSSWRHYKPEAYEKTDEWDAIVMGICVVSIAKDIEDNQ